MKPSCETCRHFALLRREPVCTNSAMTQRDFVLLENGDSVKMTMQLRIPSKDHYCSLWKRADSRSER